MANNLMFIECNKCNDEFCIGKYYPSAGWYCQKDIEQYNQWLEKHKECALIEDALEGKVFSLKYK